MGILDFIFPKKCINCGKFGDFICADCFAKIKFSEGLQCPVCVKPSINGITHPACMSTQAINGAIWAVYYGRVSRTILHKFKYEPYLSSLAPLMSEILIESLLQNESFYKYVETYRPDVIPIPLSDKRARERGYNQAELLGSYVAQYFRLKLDQGLLIRIRDTKRQHKLKKEDRIRNIGGAFDTVLNSKISDSVILIDDVATTFATLKEAAKVLKRRGAKRVLGVTFAREI